jgi:hypothetical protein
MSGNKSFEKINQDSTALLKLANQAIEWANKYVDDVAKSGVMNSVKKIRRDVKKVNKAVSKRPSVAIFGQSQVGKSYLVQNLTKPSEDTFLKIKINGKENDANFLTDMNPIGGKESTGTVTRFTIQSNEAPASNPFKVELFSLLDIAAILTNAYHSDLKDISYERENQSTEIIQNLFSDYVTSGHNSSAYNEDDVHHFVKYIITNFKSSILIQDLIESGYFNSLNEYLTEVKYENNIRILELLWNKDSFISSLFIRLSEAIKQLNYSEIVYVTEEAIMPNNTTILDVARVNELFSEVNTSKINVLLLNGVQATIERPVFAAITKEIELNIANNFEGDKDRSFIELCDVLDFPGSKSRDKIPEIVFKGNSPDQKLQLFIRGKVSYLFDYYLDNQGVSSLIYCMDNHPPEEKEAPTRLKKWIDKYVGNNPEERNKRIESILGILNKEGIYVDTVSPLMVVLTKFNVEIDKIVPGKELNQEYHSAKWQARLEENFLNFMHLSVEDKWVENWTKKSEHYSFVFPIRDPLYSQTTFEGFDRGQKETCIRPEREETVKAMGISFLSNSLVSHLIPESKKAWQEISTPNGSGISHLCKYLLPATHPVVTQVRFEAEIAKAKKELYNTLQPYLVSGDINVDLKRAELQSNLAWASITGISIKNDGSLNRILTSMIINDVEIWKLLYNFKFSFKVDEIQKSEVDISGAINSLRSLGIQIETGITEAVLIDELRNKLFQGQNDDEIINATKSMMNIDIQSLLFHLNAKTKTDQGPSFTEKVIEYWHGKMLSITQNEDLIGSLTEPQKDAIVSVINEIVKGRNRFGLGKRITEITNSLVKGTIDIKDFDLIASCCTSILNSFLFSAGWTFAKENEKPVLINKAQKIFSEYRNSVNPIELEGYHTNKYSREFVNQWSMGCKMIYTENVKYEYDVKDDLNTFANEELSNLLEEVSK